MSQQVAFLQHLGRIDEAIRLNDRVLQGFRAERETYGLVIALANHAELMAEVGRAEEAVPLIEEATNKCRELEIDLRPQVAAIRERVLARL